jgi:hypothetical protein
VQTFAHHARQPQFSVTRRLAGDDSHGVQHSDTSKSSCRCSAAPPVYFDFSRILIHPKLSMNQPGDEQEQEAERAAATVMGGSQVAKSAPRPSVTPDVSRSESGKSGSSVAAPQDVQNALRSPSQPLDTDA